MSYTSGLGYTAVFRIDQGEDDITSGFSDRLVSIRVELFSSNGNGNYCEIVLDDRDFAITSPNTSGVAGGTTIKVSLGYKENALYEMGTFTINGCVYSGPDRRMTLKGNVIDYGTDIKSPVITNFDGMSLGQIIGQIAEAGGVQPAVDPDLASIKIPFLNVHSSHLHLLQELERRFGGVSSFQDGYLAFTKRASGLTASGKQFGMFTIGPDDFGSWSITEDTRTAYSKVRAGYWDDTKNEMAWTQSTTPSVSSSSVPYILKRGFGSRTEAQEAANATMASLNRGTRSGNLTMAKGDPSIRGNQTFSILGLRDGVDGTYTIDQAVQSFTKERGIMTELSFSRADGLEDGGEGEEGKTA